MMTPYFQSHDEGYMDLDMVDLTITNFQDAEIQIGEKGNHKKQVSTFSENWAGAPEPPAKTPNWITQ